MAHLLGHTGRRLAHPPADDCPPVSDLRL